VIELQWLLADILADHEIKLKLVSSVCAIESCSYEIQKELLELDPHHLAKIFISGTDNEERMLFPPIPNFIFTRDIGIVINKHVLLNKPARKARIREALLAKYIFFNHTLFSNYHDKIIELPDTYHHFLLPRDGDDKKVTLEGGDVMVVTKDHILIGVSERTTMEAAHQAVNILFEKNIVKKISIIRIPKKRDYMHIDTIFTQVKKNVWILLGSFSKKSMKHDLGCKEKVQFIYSGNNEFPFDAREQWTDSCNLLALKEGVVLGYDRNDKTIEAFKAKGFTVIHAQELIESFEKGTIDPDEMNDTLILMPSAELSRARGGFHCMSMPLLRDEIE
jgi:arginine deiminase